MSSITNKISKNKEIKESRIKLQMLMMYFKEYDIMEHYLNYVRAKAEGKEIPKKLKLDE
jgi:hypothetical protein